MKLTDEEVAAIAATFEIEPKLLRAVAAVESGGSGFLSDGRLKILFERHYMRKRLKARDIDPTPLSEARPDLCNLKTGSYGPGGIHQWERVQAVLDWASQNAPDQFESYKKAAYESCSWGAFQIMGANYEAAGMDNVYKLKHELEKGHKEQLSAICHWMSRNGLLEKLKAKDWAGFARGYNGPKFAERGYDVKLRAAYETL